MYGRAVAWRLEGLLMSVIQSFWRGRRVRVAGALDQVAVGSPADLASIYREYGDLVYRRCYATLRDEEAALDATQDVFVAALCSFEEIRHDIVRGLLDLARTLAYERRRRPAREVASANPRAAHRLDDPAEIAERHGVLDAVWAGLSPVERRYVADKFAGFSFEEIARRNRRALGTVSSNLARAREHARKMREPMLPAVLGAGAWRRLTGFTHRARSAAHSPSVSLALQPAQSMVLSVTIAGLIAGAAPAAAVLQPAALGGPAVTGVALEHEAVPPLEVGATTRPTEAGSPVAYSSTSAGTVPASGLGLPLGIGASAQSETPEDSSIYATAASPSYAQDHTIIALGRGHACACTVLLRSTDAGWTWTATAAPPDGDQIVLPPSYPRDPRIFIGYLDESAGVSDYWSAGWGSGFAPLVGVPAGTLALPAGFDSGDARMLAATDRGVFSYDTRTGVLSTLIANPLGGVKPSLATPSGSPAAGVYVLTSSKAFAPAAPQDGAAAPQGQTVWTCPPAQMCQRTANLAGLSTTKMVVSTDFVTDHVLGLYSGTTVLLSHDGGHSFTRVAMPASAPTGSLTIAGSALRDAGVWASVQLSPTRWGLFRSGVEGNGWLTADGGNRFIAMQGGRVIAVTPDRTLMLLAQGGLLCTVNNGASWATRCPAA
jgi:RNA polymerase sigma-70 factor, ECF subfamily